MACKGRAVSRYNLGLLCRERIGVELDRARALSLLYDAAAGGLTEAKELVKEVGAP